MDIENGTDNDAKVKVSGGPGGMERGSPPREVELHLAPRQTLKMESLRSMTLPAPPWTIHFSVEIGHVKSTADVKRLTLAKMSNNGYEIKVLKEPRRVKP